MLPQYLVERKSSSCSAKMWLINVRRLQDILSHTSMMKVFSCRFDFFFMHLNLDKNIGYQSRTCHPLKNEYSIKQKVIVTICLDFLDQFNKINATRMICFAPKSWRKLNPLKHWRRALCRCFICNAMQCKISTMRCLQLPNLHGGVGTPVYCLLSTKAQSEWWMDSVAQHKHCTIQHC